MKILLRVFIYGLIILCGMALALILLPLILIFIIFMALVPGRRPKMRTFRFGSRPSPFRQQEKPDSQEFSSNPATDDIIDIEAREVGVQRKSIETQSHSRD